MRKEELKEILIKARNKKGLSHEDVATLSKEKITRQYYGMIENGERKPSVKVAQAISEVLCLEWTIFFEVNSNQKLRKIVG
ncbi:helix-turn-helix transcriptional regulator [Sporosarcina cyprini]|uniref:helix-turn-helix transcriptional regulator n=1 Tax=Sporosarcina cyprini TaxID=2910523 RepID=UPI001EDDA179|nr:helix-turn-helix transcriptional regulator [Sporosarcina cyprini]MCG3089167.1 helix-turn-helix transcriptional regulator [Sporosarcina cyprini]